MTSKADTDPAASPPAQGGWTQGDGSAADRLSLADWRRRVSTLYAEVRAMAATDPAAAHAHWRAVRERLFREHPQSPIPAAQRAGFRARHFVHDPGLRFHAVVEASPPTSSVGGPLELPNSGSDTLSWVPGTDTRMPGRNAVDKVISPQSLAIPMASAAFFTRLRKTWIS